ncbi:aspartyl protease 25-like [Iris pallida]|uniref:Aspartyl protease 25-like n=1 Tax=Iris pallida TaxID=29817 RepID=A0AAX6GTT0_IRIPA|nr:aspartyl protease 25-like [Iris pallida]
MTLTTALTLSGAAAIARHASGVELLWMSVFSTGSVRSRPVRCSVTAGVTGRSPVVAKHVSKAPREE